ncbi:MAG: hypothetical protein A2735_01390 [Candidatus Yanofskybacteria bacterium RIFCSPHIGHO2_01_FULL_41_21]|uniref:Uncharacterized protein n=1 Tax=Candidatus Yanofskybacteria bacterium RIFCSPHIGHO2_01_FULL_41_21 TaxID=1802660 RepID=A0A1F8EAE9_9BACT|nr:MAG: hypothetical protein A2735_01390 [Candidatus Yanofskybacteria bacterium RIFCSPHIGHO2_01_FULL_41_21]
MDTISNFLKTLHIPTFGEVTSSASQAAGEAATKAVVEKASQITVPGLGALSMPSLGSGELFGILVVVGILLMALTLGRTRTLISVLSIYVAFALQTIFPFFGWILKNQSLTNDLPTLRVFVFLILYSIVFGLLNRSILKTRFNLGEASFVSVVTMGLVQIGLIISIILNLAPSFYDIANKLPAGLSPFFGNQLALFYWALVPVFLLIFQKRSD